MLLEIGKVLLCAVISAGTIVGLIFAGLWLQEKLE